MDALMLYSTATLVPVAAYAVAPATSTLSVIVLIAVVWTHLKHALQTARHPPARALAVVVLALAALVVGTVNSFLLSNPAAGATLHSKADTLLVLALFALVTAACPLLALALAAGGVGGGRGTYAALLVPGLLFALVGILQERAGAGRVGWWVSPLLHADGGAWITRMLGQVGADAGVCTAGVALAELGLALLRYPLGGGTLPAAATQSEPERFAARRPLRLLAFVAAVALVGPLVPVSRYVPEHPVPDNKAWTYPPLKVGCVVPPALVSPGRDSDHGRHAHRTTLDDWIAETRVVAGRGAKVLSWSEGAVRLEKGQRGEEGDGWEAMGGDERAILERVAEVCDMYKVYVLATYLVPPTSASSHASHKDLNVATLVGPASLSPDPSARGPYLVWSTTKQHPVPLVESYAHAARLLPALGSARSALPLARVQLPPAPHTPSPRRTPSQHVAVTGAVCQDAAFPSLFATYALPAQHRQDADAAAPRAPQLVLNPSRVPPSLTGGLSRSTVEQARARALEHGAFLLRCDAGGGPALLAGPDGDVRVMVPAGDEGDGVGSWEAEIPLGRAAAAARGAGTVLDALGGTGTGGSGWIGAQARVWFALVAAVALVRIGEGGEASRWLRSVDWRGFRTRVADGVAAARRRFGDVFVRESEEGMSRAGPVTEGRLIDVE
ncbi:hypothetical protein JCM3770_005924 [Rhodotorula araucariae]